MYSKISGPRQDCWMGPHIPFPGLAGKWLPHELPPPLPCDSWAPHPAGDKGTASVLHCHGGAEG